MLQEINHEFKTDQPSGSNYVLYDVMTHAQDMWDELAPKLYELLETDEPASLSDLSFVLAILEGSSMADADLAKLAATKCKSLDQLGHVARWLAVWIRVEPTALPFLAERLDTFDDPADQKGFASAFLTDLVGGRDYKRVSKRDAFLTPEYLKRLYLLMLKYMQHPGDMRREPGTRSRRFRDEAHDAMHSLVEALRNIPGKEAFVALQEIAESQKEIGDRSRFLHFARTKAEQDADVSPWSINQLRDFHNKLDRTPSNHRELAELAELRLLDLKDDLENGDSSIAEILQRVTDEVEMRKFIGRELREKAQGRYTIPQEEELADAKKPDLRFHATSFDGPVPCELKLADNWSGPQLFERLENQLRGDYLRDNRSNRGIFVLVYRGEKKEWEIPGKEGRVDFDGLVTALKEHWQSIARSYPAVEHIEVIGIDLTKRYSRP